MHAPMISEHDWGRHPRRIIAVRDVIIKPDGPTDTAFYLLSGDMKDGMSDSHQSFIRDMAALTK